MSPFSNPRSDADLRDAFYSVKSIAELANFFEVRSQKLAFLLYGEKKIRDQYVEFHINKKNGGKRKIVAPSSTIKLLQRKLNYVLQLIYRTNISAHGFIPGRSILTGAEKHIKRKTLLNIDLKDFFHAINFGRVRGLFFERTI